jgi:hypothetical protein
MTDSITICPLHVYSKSEIVNLTEYQNLSNVYDQAVHALYQVRDRKLTEC